MINASSTLTPNVTNNVARDFRGTCKNQNEQDEQDMLRLHFFIMSIMLILLIMYFLLRYKKHDR